MIVTMVKAVGARVGPWLPWAGVLLLLVLLIEAVHPAALLAALRHAQLWLLLPVVGCGLVGLLLRGLRWHVLLKAITAPNTVLDSLLLFTAAQAALLIPGGQFLLPVLQRSEHGTLIRRSAPTILVQELVFGLLVLPAALPGVPEYHPAGWMLLAAFLFNAGTGLFLLQARILCWGLGLVGRLPIVRDHVRNLAELQHHFAVVARSRAAAWGTALDMGAIALAGLGFYLSLLAVGARQATWISSTAVYALGSSVGTLSALPGGLGANEDVSTLVLGHLVVAAGLAAAATLLFRVTNLVLGTALGWARRWAGPCCCWPAGGCTSSPRRRGWPKPSVARKRRRRRAQRRTSGRSALCRPEPGGAVAGIRHAPKRVRCAPF